MFALRKLYLQYLQGNSTYSTCKQHRRQAPHFVKAPEEAPRTGLRARKIAMGNTEVDSLTDPGGASMRTDAQRDGGT